MRQDHVEDHTTDGRFDPLAVGTALVHLFTQAARLGQSHGDSCVRADRASRVGGFDFFHRAEDHAVALALGHVHRQVVATHHHVLRRANNRSTVGGAEDVVRAHHQRVSFNLSFDRQRQVDRHLVAVEVGVESLTHQADAG